MLGRPVKLVYFDDQSNPSTVPGIYSKLARRRQSRSDRQRLRLYGQIAAAMPIAIAKKKLFISLFGTGINEQFKYDRYFSMIPNGPTPKPAFTRGFFKVAEAQKPKPQTIAIAMPMPNSAETHVKARVENAKTAGFKIVYNKSYPPATADFTPIVRAVQASNPDLFVICSYPLELGRHGAAR